MSTKVLCGAYGEDIMDTGPLLHIPLRLSPSWCAAGSVLRGIFVPWISKMTVRLQSLDARDFCIIGAETWHL